MLRPFIEERVLKNSKVLLFGAVLSFAPMQAKADLPTPDIMSNIGCSDIFDINSVLGDLSSILDFNMNIGGCSLKTSGIGKCQKKALDNVTSIEKMWGENFKYVYDGCKSGAFKKNKTALWKKRRENFALKQGGVFSISRLAKEINPNTKTVTFAGGDTTVETEEQIIKDANYMSLFSDGAEEGWISQAASHKEKALCKKTNSVLAMGCDLKKNLNIHNGIARERDRLIDDETQKISTMIDVSSTPQIIIGFPTENFANKLPKHNRKDFRKAGMIEIEQEGMFRGKMGAINNHRKAMSNLMIFKSSIEATNTYPTISQKNAKNISAGDLP